MKINEKNSFFFSLGAVSSCVGCLVHEMNLEGRREDAIKSRRRRPTQSKKHFFTIVHKITDRETKDFIYSNFIHTFESIKFRSRCRMFFD